MDTAAEMLGSVSSLEVSRMALTLIQQDYPRMRAWLDVRAYALAVCVCVCMCVCVFAHARVRARVHVCVCVCLHLSVHSAGRGLVPGTTVSPPSHAGYMTHTQVAVTVRANRSRGTLRFAHGFSVPGM